MCTTLGSVKVCSTPSSSTRVRTTVPMYSLFVEPIAVLTSIWDGTNGPWNKVLSLQMWPVAELSHTQNFEFESKVDMQLSPKSSNGVLAKTDTNAWDIGLFLAFE